MKERISYRTFGKKIRENGGESKEPVRIVKILHRVSEEGFFTIIGSPYRFFLNNKKGRSPRKSDEGKSLSISGIPDPKTKIFTVFRWAIDGNGMNVLTFNNTSKTANIARTRTQFEIKHGKQ